MKPTPTCLLLTTAAAIMPQAQQHLEMARALATVKAGERAQE